MNPRTVEEVLMDFKGRRAGIIKALTKDVELFYKLCDPKHTHLCLYGLPSQLWEVNAPTLLGQFPEPKTGINKVRDAMTKDEWLSMVALHSDSWLHAVASYFCALYKFDKADRKRLFNKITDVSLISEVIMGGTTSKRAKVENRGLPDEMMIEVLARLPVKDLLRYRSICYKWRSLIDDPKFVSAHLRRYKSNVEGSQLLVIVERPRASLTNEHVFVRRSDTFRKVTKVRNSGNIYLCHILGYVNGLALVKKGSGWLFQHIRLWNPSINKSLTVHNPMLVAMQDATYFELGLGFDASINDYKVIAIIYPRAEYNYWFGDKRYRAFTHGSIEVYSLSSNSWSTKLGVYPPSYWVVGPQVYVNGAIHWKGFGPNVTEDSWKTMSDYLYIVSFDVGNEVFNYLEMSPNGVFKPIGDTFLTVMDGCLAMFSVCSDLCLNEIWVMKEYGNSNSWSRCYTFTLQYDTCLHFKGIGEFLYAVDGIGIKSYDVKSSLVRDLAKTYCATSKYTVFTHVESLILSRLPSVPCGGN